MTSPTPEGLFTLICQTPSEAGSFSSQLKAYTGSPVHSYEALSGRSLLPPLLGFVSSQGVSGAQAMSLSVFSCPAVKTHVAGSPWSLSWALHCGWGWWELLEFFNHTRSLLCLWAHIDLPRLLLLPSCLLEPTLSSRSYKSHLPWGSLQLVFPSSAGHRPSQRYLLLKLTIHSLYLIIQQNLSST